MLALLALLLFAAGGCPALTASPPLHLVDSIDYGSFLGRLDPVWKWSADLSAPPPDGWWNMGFTGNGMLAWMITAGANSSQPGDLGTLRLEIGRTDVTDDRMPGSPGYSTDMTRCSRERLGIGYFQLETKGTVTSAEMRLVLHDAEVVGSLVTTKGSVNFTIATHALKDVNYANIKPAGDESVSWRWVPRSNNSPWSKFSGAAQDACGASYQPNPVQIHGTVRPDGADQSPGPSYTISPLLSGASFSTAWTIRMEADGSATLLSSTSQPMTNVNTLSFAHNQSSMRAASASWAAANVRVGAALGIAALRNSHQNWWHDFYRASFLTLSDSRMEAFYWTQIYKLGSATRADKPGPTYGVYDHTGPWFLPTATCCPLFNWDMNFPVEYQIVFGSNHPELARSMTRLLSDPTVYNNLATNAATIPWPAGAGPASTPTIPDEVISGPPHETSFGFIDPTASTSDYQTNLDWVLINWWNLYRSTQDATLLPDFYAVLRGEVNKQVHLAIKNKTDGSYSWPAMASPEYPDKPGPNTNYQLALTKWGLTTLLKVCDLLMCDEPRRAVFEDTLKNMRPFPVSNGSMIPGHGFLGKGLMVNSELSFTTSHRHYSHMLACWNTGILSFDKPEERQICLDSLDNWHAGQNGGACNNYTDSYYADCKPSYDMTWEWDAFSYPASSSYNARAGRAAAAYGNLSLMVETVWPKKQLNWGCKNPKTGASSGWRGEQHYSGGCVGASMQPNTFQGENGGNGHADPTSETPLAMAASVHDLMMFSDDQSDAFRVFWGVPTTLEEAAFHQLRAAGGILVSGVFSHGVTAWVAVRSVAGATNTTIFAPPDWDGKTVVAASSDHDDLAVKSRTVAVTQCETGGVDCWQIDGLQPNELVILYPEGMQPTVEQLTLKMAKGEPSSFNWWGQHPGGAGRD